MNETLTRRFKSLDGFYERRFADSFAPMLIAISGILAPIVVGTRPSLLWRPYADLPELPLIAMLAFTFVCGCYVLNVLSFNYEFRSGQLLCRRLRGGVLWQASLSNVVEVKRSGSLLLPRLKLTLSDNTYRRVWANDAMEDAIDLRLDFVTTQAVSFSPILSCSSQSCRA